MAAAAVSILTGCRPKEMQRCVDENGTVVDDKLCANQPPASAQNLTGTPLPHVYHFYYGGGGGYGIGSHAYGGSYVPLAGHSYSTSISRGGFGASFDGGGE